MASMRTSGVLDGMIGIVDQSMAGVHVYTEDGLFVDTLFVSGSEEQRTLYGLPGEFFAGDFHRAEDGAVYVTRL